MARYSDASHHIGFTHRGIIVDIYRRKKGSSCCGFEHDIDETVCLNCNAAIEPEDVYQICISGIFIPGAESTDETGAMELAMYIIDEHPDALRSPEEYVLARLDLEADYEDDWDDDEEDGPETEPPPGSLGDRFNRLLADASRAERTGRSDLLHGDGGDGDRITTELLEQAAAGASVSIVPAEPLRPGGGKLKDAARRAIQAKQIHNLKWWQRAQRIVEAARRARNKR